MQTSPELIQSRAFTEDLGPYVEEARAMYPGGRFQKIVRGFDMVFRRGLVAFTDTYNAMVLADRAQRAEIAAAREDIAPAEQPGPNPFEPDMSGVLPAGGLIY